MNLRCELDHVLQLMLLGLQSPNISQSQSYQREI